MDVFAMRNALLKEYREYIASFITIADERITRYVDESLDEGYLWPDPLIQMNPAFQPAATIETLVQEGVLHSECRKIFRVNKAGIDILGTPFVLHVMAAPTF